MPQYPKRLIEVDLPIARISAHSRREKSIRHGHISTLHIWWARRPLAACRAVICASLWPDPVDPLCPQAFRNKAAEQLLAFARRVFPEKITAEKKQLQETASPESLARWESLLQSGVELDPTDADHQNVLRFALVDFIADFANWDNSTVPAYLETSRSLTEAAHEALGGEPGTRPLVVDPFAGGGSIPLEALRVGANAFASDLNPVALLLNKVVLDFVPKHGQRLADEVRRWGKWILDQAENELRAFYPTDADGAVPIAYLWARTIRCEGPECGYTVPILGTNILRKKTSGYVAVELVPNVDTARFDPVVKATTTPPQQTSGTANRSSVTCPRCGYTTPRTRVAVQMVDKSGGASDAQLVAVVTTRKGQTGRFYRAPTAFDFAALTKAEERLREKIAEVHGPLGFLPTEPLPYLRSIFNVHVYGIRMWRDLFAPRQQLAVGTLCSLVKQLRPTLEHEYPKDRDFVSAILVCLALIVDKHADFNSSISRWANHMEKSVATFGRQALGMLWDWGEMVPIGESSGAFSVAIDWCARALDGVARIGMDSGTVQLASATAHPLPDDSASCMITDPPYYDAVPYADLSDFFYVWLKRSLEGSLLPGFDDELTPKRDEVVQLAERNPAYAYKTKENFEDLMRTAMTEGRRVVTPDGIGVIVFAHKSTSAWESMLQGLVDAGWTATASWPIDTEKGARLRALGSAALASSVHLVCRPRENPDGSLREAVGEWRDVISELPKRIHDWMPRLAEEGVVGADAIFSCLGPALEIFSRYSQVEKASGEEASLREYLEHVWAAVSTEALSMIFKDADAGGLEPDARLTAMWLWTLGAGSGKTNGNGNGPHPGPLPEGEGAVVKSTGYELEFDAARKIAQGLGIHLEKSDSFVEIKGGKARLLPVAERAQRLFGKDNEVTVGKGRRKKKPKQMTFFDELDEAEAADDGWGDVKGPAPGATVLDRVHQSMILFAAGRSEAMKRFLVEDGAGTDARFWKLAQSLSALYPAGTDEKRWVDGVLARKKGLGF